MNENTKMPESLTGAYSQQLVMPASPASYTPPTQPTITLNRKMRRRLAARRRKAK